MQLTKQANTILSGMTKQVQQLVMNATSLGEIRDGILEREPDISASDMGELLAQAITASELLGMLEIQEGR